MPYPSPVGVPNGNLANNGCGVCAASMVAENLAGVSFPPEECAVLAKACGAREGYGTNMDIFAPVFAERVGLCTRRTEDPQEVLRFLQEGRGMVIANPAGDRPGYTGLFSDSGHLIVLAEARGTEIRVWDPMYRVGSGRFDRPGRVGRVRLEGTDAFADFSEIEKDCRKRTYFLFWTKDRSNP
ncbi:MAG: hypothetical protein IJ088_12895 [Clostridia bacterium]|nr:hypothetical protein [Clostridia bacterium]